MSTSTNLNKLQINIMPEKVHDNFVNNGKINENELYLVEAEDSDVLSFDTPIASTNADYAICFEWADGNPNKEDRSHRFVIFDNNSPNKIKFTGQSSAIHENVVGVVTTCAAFIENYAIHSEYTSTVGILGVVSVIDNGACTVGECCVAGDDGYAVPSNTKTHGYRIISRVDENTVKIFIKPNDDIIDLIASVLLSLDRVSDETFAGLTKLYPGIGNNTDGSINQQALTEILSDKIDQDSLVEYTDEEVEALWEDAMGAVADADYTLILQTDLDKIESEVNAHAYTVNSINLVDDETGITYVIGISGGTIYLKPFKATLTISAPTATNITCIKNDVVLSGTVSDNVWTFYPDSPGEWVIKVESGDNIIEESVIISKAISYSATFTIS